MNTDFIAQTEYRQHENQLVDHLERRRIDADHATQEFGGSRLALMAYRARVARAAREARAVAQGPVAC